MCGNLIISQIIIAISLITAGMFAVGRKSV